MSDEIGGRWSGSNSDLLHEIRKRAERRLGELMAEQPKAKRGKLAGKKLGPVKVGVRAEVLRRR
jgi:hypothetical protein